MRKKAFNFLVLVILLLLNCVHIFAQEDSAERFSYRSFSVTPGIYIAKEPGISLNADVSFDYGPHIFSLGLGAGGEFTIWRGDDYLQANLYYGREFSISPKFVIEVYGGAGFLYFQEYGKISSEPLIYGEIFTSTIGVPIGAKFRFIVGSRYSMGVQLHGNINKAQTFGGIGLVFQWNRKRN